MSPSDLLTTFEAFLSEAHRLKAQHATSNFEILIGVESEHIHKADLETFRSLTDSRSGEIDFVVGSIHHVKGYPIDFSRPLFEKCLKSFITRGGEEIKEEDELTEQEWEVAFGKMLEEYFLAQREMLECLKPAVVAHFNLPFLFSPHRKLSVYLRAYELAKSNIEYATSYGALIELNSAGLRKGLGFAYPGEEVVRLVEELKGRWCLSDDAHSVPQVATNYGRLKEWCRGIGVNTVWRLTQGEYRVKAVEVEKIWEDDFWVNDES